MGPRQRSARLRFRLPLACLASLGLQAARGEAPSPAAPQNRTLTLDACLDLALHNNHRRPASAFTLEIAQAQHQQALAGYWPQVELETGYQLREHTPDFLFPASSFTLPAQNLAIPGLGTLTVPAQALTVPPQDVKLLGRTTFSAGLNASVLLWDGGLRKGLEAQARGGVEAARSEQRRTELEVQEAVTRLYLGAVLARQLHQLGLDSLGRLETTLALTERLYQGGSGRVKKTDYLQNKVTVAALRAALATLEKNELTAQAALANTLGLTWDASVTPAAQDIPFEPAPVPLGPAVGAAYRFNVDWKKLEAGLDALEGAATAARSGFYPKLAMTVDLHQFWNDYDQGLATSPNKQGWTLAIGLKLPVFNGNLTRNQVREARARLGRTREEQILLKEGLGLLVRDNLLSLDAARKAVEASREAVQAAAENRDLNHRAYQEELVEAREVLQAELLEALVTAQYLKSRFDHAALQAQLTLLIGNELWKHLQPVP